MAFDRLLKRLRLAPKSGEQSAKLPPHVATVYVTVVLVAMISMLIGTVLMVTVDDVGTGVPWVLVGVVTSLGAVLWLWRSHRKRDRSSDRPPSPASGRGCSTRDIVGAQD